MTISIDELSRLAGEDYRRKDAAKRLDGGDPFKKPKTEPGRARPHRQYRRLLHKTTLGGEHS